MTIFDDLAAAVQTAQAAHAECQANNERLIAENTALTDQLTQAQAQVDWYKANWQPKPTPTPPPDPIPVPPTTRRVSIGACPNVGTTAASVPAKYGPDAADRTFGNSGVNTATRPATTGIWHHSWKHDPSLIVSESLTRTSLVNAKDRDIFTLNHEPAVKYRKGSWSRTQADNSIRQFNDWHAKVVKLRDAGDIADVETCWIDAGWMFDSRSGQYPGTADDPNTAMYWLSRIDADLIGNDLDAYANFQVYPDFTSSVNNTIAAVTKFGFKGWTVPEFIHLRIQNADGTLKDTDGTLRAQWLTRMFDMLLSRPMLPRAICLYDYAFPGRPNQVILNPSKELTAVKAVMAKARTA